MKEVSSVTDLERTILSNQKIILLALSKLLTPHCHGSLLDSNGETRVNISLIDQYKLTSKILEEETKAEGDN